MSTKYIFLMGAGASRKAGILLVDEMTKKFEKYLQNEIKRKQLSLALEGLKTSIKSSKKKFDVEILLEALNKLTDPNEVWQIIKPLKDDPHARTYPQLKTTLMKFIRDTCEIIQDIDYLRPLKGFVDDTGEAGLDVFTLNYDGTLELMCEASQIPIHDGFSPDWNPEGLRNLKKGIRLHKIHGSLFWFKAGRKYVKIPLIGVDPRDLQYYTGDEAIETIIYPLITKEMYTGPFPWLIQEFRTKLLDTKVCIVIGYSFRDEAIRKIIFEQMETNPELWLYLVDPMGNKRKEIILRLHPDFFDRIVVLESKCENALKTRVLFENIRMLEIGREEEKKAYSSLLRGSQLRSEDWQKSIQLYRKLKHYDKIRAIIEDVLGYEFGTRSHTSRPIERMLLDVSVRFGIEYLIKGNNEKAKFWIGMFRDYWATQEYGLQGNETGLVKLDQLPHWHKSHYTVDQIYEDMYKDLEIEVKAAIEKLPKGHKATSILEKILQNLRKYWQASQSGALNRYFDFVVSKSGRSLFKLSTELINLIDQ